MLARTIKFALVYIYRITQFEQNQERKEIQREENTLPLSSFSPR